MRQISFALTTPQVLAGTKTVTRRIGWKGLPAQTVLQGIEKGQGLKKGQQVRKLRQILTVNVRREPLYRMTKDEPYGRAECIREGFPDLSPAEFVAMFCRANRPCEPYWLVTRIEFSYLPAPAAQHKEP